MSTREKELLSALYKETIVPRIEALSKNCPNKGNAKLFFDYLKEEHEVESFHYQHENEEGTMASTSSFVLRFTGDQLTLFLARGKCDTFPMELVPLYLHPSFGRMNLEVEFNKEGFLEWKISNREFSLITDLMVENQRKIWFNAEGAFLTGPLTRVLEGLGINDPEAMKLFQETCRALRGTDTLLGADRIYRALALFFETGSDQDRVIKSVRRSYYQAVDSRNVKPIQAVAIADAGV